MAMTTTASGLSYEDTRPGEGATPAKGQTCVMHYTGWLWVDGKKGEKFGQLARSRATVHVPARPRPRHRRLGRGHRVDANRRSAHAAHSARTRLRRTRRRRRDSAERDPAIRSRAARRAVSAPSSRVLDAATRGRYLKSRSRTVFRPSAAATSIAASHNLRI